jgi:serine/threonine-protein kinase
MMNSLQAGDRLDGYKIENLVAHGGMGCLYRATDLRDGRAVAIKVPHFEAESDPVFFDRFKREEAIGKKLDHPGVVKALDRGDPSRMYMVTEWVEGRLLRNILIEEKKLELPRAIDLTIQICEALDYIHSQGVVHRDLKPENIMVDSADRVKLIDFGIAGSAGARRLTFGKFSRIMGTPDYIAPEQLKWNRADARSDLYALGVMFYEMITGETPFNGPSPFLVMTNRLTNDPIPPRELNSRISPQIQEIVHRALERNPIHRYANAREFIADLKSPESIEVAERSEQRRRNQTSAAAGTATLLYTSLAMIPVVLFLLLLIVAHHQ